MMNKRFLLTGKWIASMMFFLVNADLVQAATKQTALNDEQVKPEFDMGNSIAYFMWVIFSLIIVVGLIVVVLKFLAKRQRAIGSTRALRLLGGVSLGVNKSMQIVQFSNKIYVLGVGDNIQIIDRIDDEEECETILKNAEQQAQVPSIDVDLLKQWLDKLVKWIKEHLLTKIKTSTGNTAVESKLLEHEEQVSESTSFQQLLQMRLEEQSKQRQKVQSLLEQSDDDERLNNK